MSDPNRSASLAPQLSLNLEENLRLHEIDAEIFAPFVIERFGGSRAAFAELSVTITDERGQEQIRVVHLRGSGSIIGLETRQENGD